MQTTFSETVERSVRPKSLPLRLVQYDMMIGEKAN